MFIPQKDLGPEKMRNRLEAWKCLEWIQKCLENQILHLESLLDRKKLVPVHRFCAPVTNKDRGTENSVSPKSHSQKAKAEQMQRQVGRLAADPQCMALPLKNKRPSLCREKTLGALLHKSKQ